MKKVSILAMLMCVALLLTSCASREISEYYESAQLYLGCGDYDYAAELFSQLGEYEDSAEYALYSRALQAVKTEKYALARANMAAVAPFKSSGRYLAWLDAKEAEARGELTQALTMYEALGTFMDAHLAAERLREEIPEAAVREGRALMAKGEYAAARELFLGLDGYGASKALAENCTVALNKAAYTEADKLAEAGDLLGAMAAFTALGDTLDAAQRADQCRAGILTALDERYAAVTLAQAPALIEDYRALGEDETAQARIDELNARFGRSLALITMDAPWIRLGSYPMLESGGEQPVCWQVIRKEGAMLTLLCSQVLDASAEAMPAALTFTEAEAAAAGEVQLPSVADLAGLPERTCTATAYALAQGAPENNGAAAYWLRDSLENGMHPMIGVSGALSLPEAGRLCGIRPVMTLDLEKLSFSMGSGTQEDPFRME